MATALQAESFGSALNTGSENAFTATEKRATTVLILDSGVGGLSVYDEIRQSLPDLSFIYAFDNACFPYGEQPEQLIIERIIAMTTALQQRYGFDLLVVACNTASTISLPALRATFPDIPIVGVVPAIKPAAKLSKNKVIGLLATRGTIQRDYTHDLMNQFAVDCQVELLGSAELVIMAEKKLCGEVPSLAAIKEILHPWLSLPVPPDTVVLGCTHFPLLRAELLQVLPCGTMLVDSAAAIARRVKSLLWESGKYQPDHSPVESATRIQRAYCTRLDSRALALLPALREYGFEGLGEVTPTIL